MAKRTELDARRQAVEMLVDVYGAELYQYVRPRFPDEETALRAFIQTWLRVFRTFHRGRARRDDRKWLFSTADEVMGMSAAAPVERSQPDIDETIFVNDNSALDTTSTEPVCEADLPTDLRYRVSQLLVATQAQVAAERVHRGPVWVSYAVAATFLAALGMIAYGVYQPARFAEAPASHAWASGPVANLPSPLHGLPTTPVAQFSLTSADDKLDITHIGVTKDTLYLPELSRPRGGASGWRMSVNACPIYRSGQSLDAVLRTVGSIHLVEPGTGSNQVRDAKDWGVVDWKFEVTDSWALTLVSWANSRIPNGSLDQVYALYIPTGRSALVSSFQPQTGLADVHVVAAGDNRVIEQSGFTNPSPRGQFTIVGLPIEVYRLRGTQPDVALSAPTVLKAPFGMMSAPTVTTTGIVFQGIAGQFQEPNATDATWFDMSWDGQLTKWIGPPLDGQPHYAVEGSSGTLYWLETTPDMTTPGAVQVLMSPLTPSSQPTPAASTLTGAVKALAVSGGYIVWVQTENNRPQIVVSTAK